MARLNRHKKKTTYGDSCADCKQVIDRQNAVVSNGYIYKLCKPCKTIETRKYAEKRKQLKKGAYWEW